MSHSSQLSEMIHPYCCKQRFDQAPSESRGTVRRVAVALRTITATAHAMRARSCACRDMMPSRANVRGWHRHQTATLGSRALSSALVCSRLLSSARPLVAIRIQTTRPQAHEPYVPHEPYVGGSIHRCRRCAVMQRPPLCGVTVAEVGGSGSGSGSGSVCRA